MTTLEEMPKREMKFDDGWLDETDGNGPDSGRGVPKGKVIQLHSAFCVKRQFRHPFLMLELHRVPSVFSTMKQHSVKLKSRWSCTSDTGHQSTMRCG